MASVVATLKSRRARRCDYPDRDAAPRDLFAYREGYSNRRQIHSALGHITQSRQTRKPSNPPSGGPSTSRGGKFGGWWPALSAECASLFRPALYSPGLMQPYSFGHRHLLGIEGLSREDIEHVLDLADTYVELSRQTDKKTATLRGRTLINCFFENSTRTRTSFEVAGKRLGADVINMAVAVSAMRKGETLIDTAMTLNAMHPDVLVVRHPESGAVQLLSEKVDCAVINGGDGSHEHPTQALLDALTIRRRKGRLGGLTVAICGDILHSRVARSNIALLNVMGARVRVVAPRTLLPAEVERLGVEVFHDMTAGLRDVDIVMMLRLQMERMHGSFIPVDPRVFSLLRSRLRQAEARETGRADHASGTDEPRRRDRQRGRRRYRPQPDPPAGRDGGRGPDGVPRNPDPRPRQQPAGAVTSMPAMPAYPHPDPPPQAGAGYFGRLAVTPLPRLRGRVGWGNAS